MGNYLSSIRKPRSLAGRSSLRMKNKESCLETERAMEGRERKSF